MEWRQLWVYVSLCLLYLWSVTYCFLCIKTETLVYEMQMLAQYCKSSAIRGLTYHTLLVLKLVYWSSSEHGWEEADACYSDLSDDKHNNCSYRWRSCTGGWYPYLSGMKISMAMQWGPTGLDHTRELGFKPKLNCSGLNKALDPLDLFLYLLPYETFRNTE